MNLYFIMATALHTRIVVEKNRALYSFWIGRLGPMYLGAFGLLFIGYALQLKLLAQNNYIINCYENKEIWIHE